MCATHSASKFNWIVHGCGSGTLFDAIKQNLIPFTVLVAMDIYPQGRNLMQTIINVPHVFSNSDELLTHIIRALKGCVQGYYVTVPALYSRSDNNRYFRYQIEIIKHLKQHHKLMVIAFEMNDCTTCTITDRFESDLASNNWTISKQCCKFPEFGDSIDGSSTFLFGFNAESTPDATKIQIAIPPSVTSCISQHLMTDYDILRYSLIETPASIDVPVTNNTFTLDTVTHDTPVNKLTAKVTHRLRYNHMPASAQIGTQVCNITHPAPALSVDNLNIFRTLFGIEFTVSSGTHIRCISRYEYGRCYGLSHNYNRSLCPQSSNFNILANGCPGRTMGTIVTELFDTLLSHRNSVLSTNIDQSLPVAPAATAFSMLNGATSIPIPSPEAWRLAYMSDPECKLVMAFLDDPSTITNKNLQTVHHRLRQPLRQSTLIKDDPYIFLREHINSDTYVNLRLVPFDLRKTLFLAFHSNPLGGHYSVYYTFHRLRLRYFWPGMYSFIKRT